VQFLDLSASEKPWLTVEAAAQILNKSERTILRWIKQGKLPSKKVGKEHHIDPQDLEEVASWQNIESAKPPRAYQITCGRLRFLFAMLGMSQRKLAYASQIILSLKLNMLRLHWCRRGDSATTVVRLTLTSCVASPQSLIKTSCFDSPC
jgi:excisionase family DNA binding protein